MNRFKELKVWQKSIDIVVDVYRLTANFPQNERFGLTSQIQRASVSIPSNIAEGAGRNSKKEFNQFLGIANGSSFEIETQLTVAYKLGYISEENLNSITPKINEVQNMIFKLQKTLIE
jgi:four helix bundle protein